MRAGTLTRAETDHARRKQRQRWNRGMVGEPAPPKYASGLTEPCYTDRCGEAYGLDELGADGWTLTLVCGSNEPPRWWCSLRCAGRGIALAELRRYPRDVSDRPADRCPDGCGAAFTPDSPARPGWVLTCHFTSAGSATTWWCCGSCAQPGLTALAAATRREVTQA